MGTYIFTAKVKNAQQLKKLPGYIAALLSKTCPDNIAKILLKVALNNNEIK
jgi:hypothetical protein